MFAIYKRELKAYFQTVIGWLFIAATLALFGLYYYLYCFAYGYPYLSAVLSGISFIFLITVPVLTMRIIAEDRRSKTDQLILTSPVSVGGIVAGKYLAMATIYCIPVVIMLASGLLLSSFGTVPTSENLSAVFGFWLYGLVCIAIGMFISSLTESQVIAAVLSFAVLFLGYMMSGITSLISSTGNWLTAVLGCFDLTKDLDNFFSGFFDLTGMVYYLTMIGLFLFLTVQSIQKRRWSMAGKKRLKQGFFGTGMIVFAVVLVLVVNLAAGELPSTLTSIDVTSQQLYSMTDETKTALKLLDEDVTIYVLQAQDSADATLDKTLELFAESSDHITVEYKDPAVSPTFYQNYTDSTTLRMNSLIVVSEKRSRVINYSEIYETEIDYTTYTSETTGYDGEGQVMSAIAYVTSDDMPELYNIIGHGEATIDGTFAEAVEKANITMTDLSLLTVDALDADFDGIIINAPQSDFSQDDAQKVIDYLKAGGKALIITGVVQADMPNFESILEEYGILLANGMVLESDRNYYYSAPYWLLPEVQSHTLTSNISDYYVFLPYSRGMTYAQELPENVTIEDLIATSDSAFSKADTNNMTSYDMEDGDIAGPFVLGLEVTATQTESGEDTKLYVFSCDEMFTDAADSMVSGYNLKLFSNVIGEFSQDTAVSSIPVKSYESMTIVVNEQTALFVGIAMTIVIPLLMLAAGLVIWVERRKR